MHDERGIVESPHKYAYRASSIVFAKNITPKNRPTTLFEESMGVFGEIKECTQFAQYIGHKHETENTIIPMNLCIHGRFSKPLFEVNRF